MPIDDAIEPVPDIMSAKPQRIEVGRADLTELTRRLGKRLKQDQKERAANPNAGDQVRPGGLAVVAYPCEWSPMTGHAIAYEVCTTSKVGGLGTYLRARGPTVERAMFRMRWVLVQALMHIRQLPMDAAKRISRKSPVHLVDVLPSCPDEMKP